MDWKHLGMKRTEKVITNIYWYVILHKYAVKTRQGKENGNQLCLILISNLSILDMNYLNKSPTVVCDTVYQCVPMLVYALFCNYAT